MPYVKTVWVDELLGGAERFEVKDNLGAAVDSWDDLANAQIVLKTTVTTPGTSVDAANLNHLEDGLEAIAADGAILAANLASNAVETAKINALAVTAAKLAADAVETAKIKDAAVTGAKISHLGIGALADPGADRILFWDDSSNIVTWLTLSGLQIIGTELSPIVNDDVTGVYLKVLADAEGWAIADGKLYWTVPSSLNLANLTSIQIYCYTPSTSGLPSVQVTRGRRATPTSTPTYVGMLSTQATIDANEFSSTDAATPPVINTTYDDVATRDVIRIDITAIGTGTKGLDVMLVFTK